MLFLLIPLLIIAIAKLLPEIEPITLEDYIMQHEPHSLHDIERLEREFCNMNIARYTLNNIR